MQQDKTPTLAVNIIYRDNSDSIIDCLNSTLPTGAEEYVFCDTGDKGKTTKLIEDWCKRNEKTCKIHKYKDKYGFHWGEVEDKKWNFGNARQIALENTESDVMLWIDTDDVIENAQVIPKLLQLFQDGNLDQIILPYRYGVDQYGNDVVLLYRERLIKVKGAEWREPVHEHIHHSEQPKMKVITDVKVRHKRKPEHVKRTSRRNRNILHYQYEQLREENKKPHLRLLQNLAYDHYEHKEWKQASRFYKEYFDLYSEKGKKENKNQHNSQIMYNYLNWAKSLVGLSKLDEAEDKLKQVQDLDELNPFVYLEFAHIRVMQGKLEAAQFYLETLESLEFKPSLLPVNKVDLKVKPLIYRIEIENRKANFDKSLEYLSKAREILPNDERFKNLHSLIIRNREQKKAFDGYYSLKNELLSLGDWGRLGQLIKSLPPSILNQDAIKEDVKISKHEVEFNEHRLEKIEVKDKKDIAIFTGPAYEEWAGDARQTGIGGSEEMVIGLADQLTKIGNKVTVYGDPGSKAGNYDDVKYTSYKNYEGAIKHDVLIVSRMPQMFLNAHASKRQYLWLHDTYYGDLPTRAFGLADKIFVLSEFHKHIIKSKYNLPDKKFWVTRNGIDIEHYSQLEQPEIDRNQLIYCSSYDRGLYEALLGLKEIRKTHPDVNLKVFYGWNVYDKRMEKMPENYSDHPSHMSMREYKKRVIELMDELGVKDGGRIGQEELFLEMAKSNIWYYPTWFSEISCITAMRAQYAGSIPVCSPVAALNETVKVGFKGNEQANIDKIKELLDNPGLADETRKNAIKAGETFSLKSLAKDWDNFFEK